MLKNVEWCLLLSSDGHVKARDICKEMFKKLKQKVELDIGYLYVPDVEEQRRGNNVVI